MNTYVIALIEEGENQLEFYSTLMFRQGSVIDDGIFAVGLASGYDDAHAKVAFSARKNIRRPTNIIYYGDSFHKDAYQVILDQSGYDDALYLVEEIAKEVYEETGDLDIRSYIRKQERKEE